MPLKVMLADKYNDKKHSVIGWYMSHKIDGIRAYWDYNRGMLVTRNDKQIYAPQWFLDGMPDFDLDGELVFAPDGNECGQFQKTCSVVKRHNADDRWNHVKYFVFESPSWPFTFDAVYDALKSRLFCAHITVLKQVKCESIAQMRKMHDEYTAREGEGLMLRDPHSEYVPKRSKQLLKVKIWDDAEAVVIEHHPGEGKHEGRLGGCICTWHDGRNDRTFHVGVGFTDAERDDPPKIGSTITFSYFGMTDGGSPRHPKYLRIREDM
jgi:DNA ligase 1